MSSLSECEKGYRRWISPNQEKSKPNVTKPTNEPVEPDARARERSLELACKLVLLFHSGTPWTWEKQQEWANGLTELLGSAAGRDPKIVGANADGTWDGAEPTNEATTKNLCNAVRAALK